MKRFHKHSLACILIIFSLLLMAGCEETVSDDEEPSFSASPFLVLNIDDNLADNTVNDIAVDHLRNGTWFATMNGISFFSNADSSITTYGAEYNISDLEVYAISLDYMTGEVWAGTTTGPSYYDGDTWNFFSMSDSLIHKFVTVITPSSDGSLWFGTRGGVSRWDRFDGWQSWTTANGLVDNMVNDIEFSSDNTPWIATNNGISFRSGNTWDSYDGTYISNAYVNTLHRSYDGAMWCGTISGVSVATPDSWKRYGTLDGLPSPMINDMAQDTEKIIWAATDAGLTYLSASKWKTVTLPDNVSSERILSLSADVINNILWLGTTGGAVRYDLSR